MYESTKRLHMYISYMEDTKYLITWFRTINMVHTTNTTKVHVATNVFFIDTNVQRDLGVINMKPYNLQILLFRKN